jgi:hypothetical protein
MHKVLHTLSQEYIHIYACICAKWKIANLVIKTSSSLSEIKRQKHSNPVRSKNLLLCECQHDSRHCEMCASHCYKVEFARNPVI